ncbi:hypothetical protein ACUUMC_16180 [Paenarthrobacter nitroguajacolicus]
MLQPTSAFAANAVIQEEVSGAEAQHDSIFVVSEADIAPEVVGAAIFIPLPENAKNSLVVLPEVAQSLGLKPGKVSKSDEIRLYGELAGTKKSSHDSKKSGSSITLMSDPNWTNFWAPWGNGWSGEIRRNTSFSSPNGKYYNWYMDSSTNTTACALGVGYYQGYNGSSFELWRAWYDIGCGRAATVRVPWDNVLAYPAFNVRSISWTGGFGQFQ